MKKLLLLILVGLTIFVAGCIQQNRYMTTLEPTRTTSGPTRTTSGPTHGLIEYLSMENPESFSYNSTESFSMFMGSFHQLSKTENYRYYKKGSLEAIYNHFIFFTLPNGSTYGCIRDSKGENIKYCGIGVNEFTWKTTKPRYNYKKVLLDSLENYTSKNYTSSENILGRKTDCFKLDYDIPDYGSGSSKICFDVETGIIMKFESSSKSGKYPSSLSLVATGLSLNPPPDDVFILPQPKK